MPPKKIVFPTKPRRIRRSAKQGRLRLKEMRERRRDRKLWQHDVGISRHHKAGISTHNRGISNSKSAPRVAIIGGGAGGLVSLRYCLAAGLNATLFEQSDGIGGVWRYNSENPSLYQNSFPSSHKSSSADMRTNKFVESGQNHSLPRNSPMYESLVTNLPKEIMAFFDFPFKSNLPSFITHEDMLSYLYEYAYHNHLMGHIRCSKTLLRMWRVSTFSEGAQTSSSATANDLACRESIDETVKANTHKWMLEFDGNDNQYGYTTTHNFDAVIVANGHYSQPHFPKIQGAESFPGKIMHSIDFDEPSVFKNKHVLILGAKASGTDIAMQIKHFATKVVVCDKYFQADMDPASLKMKYEHEKISNVFWHCNIDRFHSDGSIDTVDGKRIENIDVVIYCTGYEYSFPFCKNEKFPEGETIVHTSGRRVNNLYKQCIHKGMPSLSFVGLPYSVVPYQLMELQAKLISSFIAGEIGLVFDDKDDAEDNEDEENILHAHFLGQKQWDYCADLLEIWQSKSNSESPAIQKDALDASNRLNFIENDDIPWDIPSSHDILAQLKINREIWQDVASKRPKYVGGNAKYRDIFYEVVQMGNDDTPDDQLSSSSNYHEKTWFILNEEQVKQRKIDLKDYYDNLARSKSSKHSDEEMDYLKKMKKLLSKMKNIESQLPNIPTTKQWDECLLGIERCASWWRELIFDTNDQDVAKTYSMNLWMLVQHAMQSGPLINSKPAYFKRAQYPQIKRSFDFLTNISNIGELGFSDAQKKRLSKFLSDSDKALSKAIVKGEDKIFELKDGIHSVGNKKKISKDKKKKHKKKTKNNKL